MNLEHIVAPAPINLAPQLQADHFWKVFGSMISLIKRSASGLLFVFGAAHASDPISAGYVSNLSYRAGYVMFSIVNGSGVNACAACPTDPGAMSAQNCWVAQSQTAELSILLLASAQGKMVAGRVNSLATDCTLYQLNVQS